MNCWLKLEKVLLTSFLKNQLIMELLQYYLLIFTLLATDSANQKKDKATEKSVEMELQAKIIATEKAEAQEVLADAMPALEAARAALSELEKSDITEIR